jgi:SRSO17 transposase
MRFAWVGVDAGYGKTPAFLRALDDMGEVFVADVHATQRLWAEPPGLHVPAPKAKGRPPGQQQAAVDGITVEKRVAGFGADEWTRCILRDSTRGPLRVDIAHRRVWVWDSKEAAARCWHLIVRREVGAPKRIKYSLSNASADTPLQRLAQMQGARYWVERAFADAKGECSLEHLWPDWNCQSFRNGCQV